MKITAHCIVKNEDIWVWYAINSVLPYVEKVLIFDTGSDDNTVKIIKSINSDKLIFEEKGSVDKKGLVALRKEQIGLTETEWLLILDGDEIWPGKQIKKLIQQAKEASANTKAFFNKTKNCIGDIYHYLPDEAGKYNLGGVKGNLNIRLIRKTNGLNIIGEYPLESYIDEEGEISKQIDNIFFVDCWYLHTTYLKRTTSGVSKASGSLGKSKFWEKGLKIKKKKLPEVLFGNHPDIVPKVVKRRGLYYEAVSSITTPFINFKRKFL